MHKRSQKKKKRHGRGDNGKNKENRPDLDNLEAEEDGFTNEDCKPIADSKELCYEVKTSEIMGRYLVASRDIKAGEIIIKEPALVVGPCAGCAVICLGCYRELDERNIFKCPECKWPLCGESCLGLGKWVGHSAEECKVLRTVQPDYKDMEDLKDSYQAIMPLRCLLLKSSYPAKWQAVTVMEAHNEIRRARGDIWPHNQNHVVDRIKKWGLDFDEEEIHTICGVLEVNAFEVGGGDCSGGSARALYDRAYLLSHSCACSTTHTDAELQPQRPLTVRAAVPHAKGDLITLCYAYTLQGTLKRRSHLRLSKFFSCVCSRCADASELGTFASAFVCPRCGGRVLSREPLRDQAAWHCGQCAYAMAASSVTMLLQRLTDEYDRIDANDVKGFEGFLHEYRNVLYRSHYLNLSAKHSLSQLYGKIADFMIQDMSEDELKRKIEICRDIMEVFDVIEPGLSRLRGVTLYELHAPLMILTTRDFEKKAITKENLRSRLKEIVGYLTESALILGFEPPNSSEGLMASAARDALKKIKTWEKIIGKIS